MSATAARTFTLSRSLRLVAAVQFAVLLVLLAVAFAGDRQLSTREAGLLWILFAVLAFWVNLELNATRVTLDAEGVAIHRSFGFWRRFRWAEIDDLDCSPRLISIAVRGLTSRVKLFRPVRGFALESFDELQEEIAERVMPRLLETWNRVAVPVVYPYPGLPRGVILADLGGVAAVLIGPLLFAVSVAGFAALKLLFVTVSLGLLSPFFLRDWRRAHGVLRLELDRMEGINGRSVLVMPWRAIAQLIIRDPGCGLGWIIVVDRRRIRIHARLENAARFGTSSPSESDWPKTSTRNSGRDER